MSETSNTFNWSEAWYAVQFVRDLGKRSYPEGNRTKPTRFVLLEQPLVIWWQKKTQQWVLLADRCPHRLAPLSEGRITEDGCLECPYHGWAFTETGSCDRIPFQNVALSCRKSFWASDHRCLRHPDRQRKMSHHCPVAIPI